MTKSFSQIIISKVSSNLDAFFHFLCVLTNRVAGGDQYACNWLTQTRPAIVNGKKVSLKVEKHKYKSPTESFINSRSHFIFGR